MITYKIDECAVFYKTREHLGELSNMHNDFPLEWGGRTVGSSEALYQAMKFDPAVVAEDGLRPFEVVIQQRNSMVSKMKAKKYRAFMLPEWHDIKLDVMEMCLRLKYDQHRATMDAVLDETGNLPIVERSRKDRLWGAVNDYHGNLIGENLLGQLWMILRSSRSSSSL
jgi:ribA/ribD-fused uncharacterized protein